MALHKIALIHAVLPAMAPVEAAFRTLWPEPRLINLFDDSLGVDLEAAGALTPSLSQRIRSLADYALSAGADGILYTCSAFGEAIEAVQKDFPVPVLKPNEAMFETALAAGGPAGMLATFAPSVASMEQEFAEMARRQNSSATIHTVLVPNARDAVMAGDGATHDALIAAAADKMDEFGVAMLAHFSMSRAEAQVRARTKATVLTAPGTAVLKLRSTLEGA